MAPADAHESNKARDGNNVSASDPRVPEFDPHSLGEEIRKLRKARGKSLAELSLAIGRSISFVSQVERAGAIPSIADLRAIAFALGVPLGWFFLSEQTPANERGVVVRAGSRRRLGTITDGLVEELLSPSIGGSFEVFLSTFAPGAGMAEPTTRDTEEEGYLVKGQLDIWIGGRHYQLATGDSFRIDHHPFQWTNTGEQDAVVVWVIAPPVY
jgi:transcriptional regulator with XRE-family HTH domain